MQHQYYVISLLLKLFVYSVSVCFEEGVDYIGHTWSYSGSVTNKEGCHALCLTIPECTVAVSDYASGCWIKNETSTNLDYRADRVSHQRVCP